MKQGMVFDFHRGTTHDGPGMRTTVFMKGCPLHCEWCHNPESIERHQQLQWTEKKCIACRTCEITCKQHAISLTEDGVVIQKSKCNKCMECAEECPAKALEVVGKYWEADALAKEAMKDQDFFKEFDGGITVSGGEPMLQYEFLVPFLKILKEKEQHVALDTCGYASWKAYEEVYPYVDTFLYDIKLMDSEQHKKFTGVPNELILENLVKLANKVSQDPNKEIWIRTPLIPGATVSEENISKIGQFIKDNLMGAVTRWELCAFNNVCRDKYIKLNRQWKYKDEALMTESLVDSCLNIAKSYVGELAMTSGLTAKE